MDPHSQLSEDRSLHWLDLDPAVRLARQNLGEWALARAQEIQAEFGFGFRPAAIAPTSLDDLRTEFRACQISGLPLRVSDRFCEQTIYPTPHHNVAFRFFHDSRHVFLDAQFTTEDELLVASCHLARLTHDGFGNGTVEYRLLFADTVGQTRFVAEANEFVIDQKRFALRCLTTDLSTAISDELFAQRFGGTAA